jgi:hypothetical protein
MCVFIEDFDWRRGWDSNPRAGYPTRRFRGAPVTTTSVPLRSTSASRTFHYSASVRHLTLAAEHHRQTMSSNFMTDNDADIGASCARHSKSRVPLRRTGA